MFDVYTSTVSVFVKAQKLVSRSLTLPYFYLCNYASFKQNIDDCMSVLVHTLCEVTGGDEMSPSTHLRAGHLASHLEKKQNITVKYDEIGDLLLHVFSARFTHIDVFW